jgi:hypothetical protein
VTPSRQVLLRNVVSQRFTRAAREQCQFLRYTLACDRTERYIHFAATALPCLDTRLRRFERQDLKRRHYTVRLHRQSCSRICCPDDGRG